VLAEASRMVRQGTVEISLLGQNVNAYHGADGKGATAGLGELMRRLADIDGLERIRYTTSHPRDVDDDLIAAHRDVPQIMPFLHLPVQSGSDRILQAMNRRHTVARYHEIIGKLRDARPDIALSSDFIVGYPGETDADFQATMDLVHQVGFAFAYSFKYSPRPGTPAADLDEQVPEDVKSARLAVLQDELLRQQEAFNAASVGRIMPVLLERDGRHPGQLVGRSPYMQAVSVDAGSTAGELKGTIRNVEIAAVLSNSLRGRLTEPVSMVAAE